ncbi:MAG: hypothetical protein ACK40G_11780 [Cytophagaceae bacterium]
MDWKSDCKPTTQFIIRLIIISLFTFSFNCYAQNSESEVRATFNEFCEAKKSLDIDTQLDLIHPKVFEYFSMENMRLSIQELNNSTIRSQVDSLKGISSIIKFNGSKYCLIKYTELMFVDFSDIKDEGGASLAIGLGLGEFRKLYGEENVRFDKEKALITVTFHLEMYAIKDNDNSSWKFLFKDDNIDKKVIPKEVLDKL